MYRIFSLYLLELRLYEKTKRKNPQHFKAIYKYAPQQGKQHAFLDNLTAVIYA